MKLRQKYYFVDYTDKISYTKRILKILRKQSKDNVVDIGIDSIIRSLRWGNGIFDFDRDTLVPMSVDAKLYAIERAIDILKQLDIITAVKTVSEKKFDETHPVLSSLNFRYTMHLSSGNCDFDQLVQNSGFVPVEGRKQVLTDEMMQIYRDTLAINYQQELDKIDKTGIYGNIISTFIMALLPVWKSKYKLMGRHIPDFKGSLFDSFYILYDDYGSNEEIDILSEMFVEDRTVVAYARSTAPAKDRKMNDFYMTGDNQRKWADKNTDRGHFIGHTMGGDILMNIFPQRRDINQGHSERGKVYVSMEKFIRKNPGIFCFARPVYFDFSNRPYLLEYGYITKDFQLVLEVFENV